MWHEPTNWIEASTEEFAEIPNLAFRRLHTEAVELDIVKRRFMNEQKPAARAMLIKLQPLLEAAAGGRNGLTLSGFTLDQVELSPATEALIISTTSENMVRDLIFGLTEGQLGNQWPADWFGVQNTPDCIRALNEAIKKITVIYPGVEGVLGFSDTNPRSEFKIYQSSQGPIADLVGNDQRVEPQS
jgi:hypothetical protein